MPDNAPISFGDRVHIRSSELTQERGLAGLVGHVHGETTPSVTGVEVLGASKGDYAIYVYFEDHKAGYWFEPGLVEFVDHAPGSEIRLKGVPKKWMRISTGEWLEERIDEKQPRKKPWWKFW
jgi:hypothetical protein